VPVPRVPAFLLPGMCGALRWPSAVCHLHRESERSASGSGEEKLTPGADSTWRSGFDLHLGGLLLFRLDHFAGPRDSSGDEFGVWNRQPPL